MSSVSKREVWTNMSNIDIRKSNHLSPIWFLYRNLQILGFFPIDIQISGWKSHLHMFSRWFHMSFCVVAIISHFLSTILHSVHYLPEFFSCLLEDVTIICTAVIILAFQYRIDFIRSVIHFMETKFSTVDPKILAECHRKMLTTVKLFVALFMCVMAGLLAQWLTPMTEDELKLREALHGSKRQARRLMVNLWLPGLDETESWTYELLCLVQAYLAVTCALWSYVFFVTIFPMIVINAEGQMKILCRHIEMLGSPHKDSEGNQIFYTHFETNTYVSVSSVLNFRTWSASPNSRKTTQELELLKRINVNKLRAYEREYLKQLIRFHQNLLTFIEQIFQKIAPGVLLIVIANYLNISITLYQVMVYSGHQSKTTLFKFLTELTLTLIQFYYYCDTMELWDDCQARMRTSLYFSRWYTCSLSTRKDIFLLLSRLRKPRHPRFCQGVIVLCNPWFVGLLRVCYQAVNFMRLRGV
ncbi:hypothetical protein WDU94_000255 [Cyamophila willieti]